MTYIYIYIYIYIYVNGCAFQSFRSLIFRKHCHSFHNGSNTLLCIAPKPLDTPNDRSTLFGSRRVITNLLKLAWKSLCARNHCSKPVIEVTIHNRPALLLTTPCYSVHGYACVHTCMCTYLSVSIYIYIYIFVNQGSGTIPVVFREPTGSARGDDRGSVYVAFWYCVFFCFNYNTKWVQWIK